ncbi:MAG TPA: transcriptional regulator [Opitutae bacterium]|nr:transcriptional regulator [Opitutaceae bacterium]HCR31290.1 transcriptional regulator [Opitutae bacterium]
MKPAWDTLKVLAEPTRLRILAMLLSEELSVAELQEALGMSQSRISSQLALLRQADLVVDRRDGKKSFYSIQPHLEASDESLIKAAINAVANSPEMKEDEESLRRVIQKRRKVAEEYFNLIAGRLGKNYCPGRSWEAIGHMLLHFVPKIVVADLGAGEGMISQLIARQAESVYCIDNSPQMVEVGKELAERNCLENLHYLLGDIEDAPLKDETAHISLLSQALHHANRPEKAIAEAFRITKRGGRIIILDLKEHSFEKARELYADTWLGFAENKIHSWLNNAGFENVSVSTVAKEDDEPHFETILATGIKR